MRRARPAAPRRVSALRACALPHPPPVRSPRYTFDETDEALDKEPLAEWWAKETAAAAVRWRRELGIVDEPDAPPRPPPPPRDDDDDDELEWEELQPGDAASVQLRRPPAGCAAAPELIDASALGDGAPPAPPPSAGWPYSSTLAALPASALEPPTLVTDYAWDGSGRAAVKVYVALARGAAALVLSPACYAEFSEHTARVEVLINGGGAGVVGARRVCFSARLARAILPEKSSAKVKPEKGELVITLKKAEPGVEWSTLLRDVNE